MSVPTAEALLADLARVPLLTLSQLRRVGEAAGRGAHSAEKVVARLVEKGWVTPFQGETLLAGRAGSLVVGPYLLLAQLGEGGMGRVYKARHLRLGRVDAVKVIRADKLAASKILAQRFAREIRLTSTLSHPNLVHAIDAGEFGSQLYLATEFVDGEDLVTTVRRAGPLPPADVCLVGYQACLALQYVFEKGLVHRDVKPSNLMREYATKAVKLMDLGLSGVRAEAAGESLAGGALTADGVMLGTPDFMPPEQARDPHGVDIRADLYGLGGTLFFLLTGRPPYSGTAVEKLIAHGSAPVPPVITPTGPAPPALAAVVTKLLAKKPEDRYPTPAAVAEALLGLRPGARSTVVTPTLGAETAVAEPVPDPGSEEWQISFGQMVDEAESRPRMPIVPSPPRRSRHWVWPVAAGVVLLVGLVAAVLSRGRPPESTPPPPPPTPAAPHDELRDLRAAVATPGEDREAVRRRVLDYRTRHAGTAHATGAAGLLRRLPSPLDALVAGDGGPIQVTGAGPGVAAVAFGPDDTRLVVCRFGRVPVEFALPNPTATERFAQVELADGTNPAVTSDGHVVAAVGRDRALAVWDTTGLRRVAVPGTSVRAVATDGMTVVVVPVNPDGALVRIDLATGKTLSTLDVRAPGVRAVTLAADGAACLVTGADIARVVPLPAGAPVRTLPVMPELPTPPGGVFAPDGGRLYLIGVEPTAVRVPAGSGVADVRYDVPPDPADRRAGPWRMVPRVARPTCVAVAADESQVAVGTASGRLAVFVGATGAVVHAINLPGGVSAIAFAPSGRALAVALDGGRVVLVPLPR